MKNVEAAKGERMAFIAAVQSWKVSRVSLPGLKRISQSKDSIKVNIRAMKIAAEEILQ